MRLLPISDSGLLADAVLRLEKSLVHANLDTCRGEKHGDHKGDRKPEPRKNEETDERRNDANADGLSKTNVLRSWEYSPRRSANDGSKNDVSDESENKAHDGAPCSAGEVDGALPVFVERTEVSRIPASVPTRKECLPNMRTTSHRNASRIDDSPQRIDASHVASGTKISNAGGINFPTVSPCRQPG